jgi:hypothetical protein
MLAIADWRRHTNKYYIHFYTIKIQGKSIDREHELYHLTYGMMCGIRTTVSLANQDIGVKLLEWDFMATDKFVFPPQGSKSGGPGGLPTPPHHLPFTFKFKDYAPAVFRQLRYRFGIDPSDYLTDLCGDFNYIEFISNSKSGQFFFYSHNGKLMIKTQSPAESKFLRRILPRYYVYVMRNPNTLLTRFYGMHRVKMSHLFNKNVRFIIMHSVFDTDKEIHAMYDLKGSHIGRAATEEDKKRSHPVLKDCDFEDEGRFIALGKERKKIFMDQIKKDSDFLATLKIMDYSLLIGIHKHRAPASSASLRTSSVVLTEKAKMSRSPSTRTKSVSFFSESPPMHPSPSPAGVDGEERGVEEGKSKDRGDSITSIDPEYELAMKRIQMDDERRAKGTTHVPIFTTEDGGVYGINDKGAWNEVLLVFYLSFSLAC